MKRSFNKIIKIPRKGIDNIEESGMGVYYKHGLIKTRNNDRRHWQKQKM